MFIITKLNRFLREFFKSQNAFENLLHEPYEFLVGGFGVATGSMMIFEHQHLAVDLKSGLILGGLCFALAYIRIIQGVEVITYQRNLLKLSPFSMSTQDVPASQKDLFIGKGFKWGLIHRQRLHLLSMVGNEYYLQPGLLRPAVKSEIGGKPWLHGVGANDEKDITLSQGARNGHMLVFGMTRVGKTRLLSILVNQDIRNHDAVIVIDPKGDLEVLQDIYSACAAAGRLQDLMVLHPGFPQVSAKYNPLASFSNVSEVATRVASAISASGEGKQFQDFAWKFLNITAACILEMGEPMCYKTLSFYVARPKQTLLAYCDRILPKADPHYLQKIEAVIQEFKKTDDNGSVIEIARSQAINIYLHRYIEEVTAKGDATALHSTITDLHHAANVGDEFYGKITASLGPVFDKINKTSASEVFSWSYNFGLPEIKLANVIKRKKVLYIGLDAMVNKAMAEAVGQALISDLVSLAGRMYKDNQGQEYTLKIHADEFAEIVRDEFITLLNKAGGAGYSVTAYTQTKNDIGAVFSGNADKPEMILGNFGTKVMLRVANDETAKIMTDAVEEVRARSLTPSTMSNDKADGSSGDLFTTYNTDTITESSHKIIVENDLTSLPKGQAFVLTNGGELYKIRIPLPKNDGNAPKSFAAIMSEVNL
ncbi:MAG: conjugative transfer system coupling protein TraD [Gammaproteobacteria bacterium]|nr:conjugative transfer system coupling protein TraD [Gammaproteobacteria bacterium]